MEQSQILAKVVFVDTLLPPATPLQAVYHPDPYSYYAALTRDHPFYYDPTLAMWVASSAQAVTDVLSSPICRVRPVTEPVPSSLQGSTAGHIFGAMVRMNDGPVHTALKPHIRSALHTVHVPQMETICIREALALVNTLDVRQIPSWLTTFAFRLPIRVMGTLLELPEDQLWQTEQWIADFVRCIAPGSPPDQIECGKAAADELYRLFESTYERNTPASTHLDLFELRSSLSEAPQPISIVTANAIGLLCQAYEATAGLICNTVLALHNHPDVLHEVILHPTLLVPLLEEVARYDSPVQNTRRFVAEDGKVAGESVNLGDQILVILAAANRDETVNPNPAQFDLSRPDRVLFTFGHGRHGCPGDRLALEIARVATGVLVERLDFATLPTGFGYRPSRNTRIPLFTESAQA